MANYVVIPVIPAPGGEVTAAGGGGAAGLERFSETFARGILDRLDCDVGGIEVIRGNRAPERVRVAEGGESDRVVVRTLPAINVLLVNGPPSLESHLRRDRDVSLVADATGQLFRAPAPKRGAARQPHDWPATEIALAGARAAGLHGKGVWIGFADTGIEANHREFGGHAMIDFAEIDGSGGISSTSAYDSVADGHGTRVAAIACGTNIGIAPEARILMALALPNLFGTFNHVLGAMNWLASVTRPDGGAGVHLINMSFYATDAFGRATYSAIYKPIIATLQGRGIEVIASIGNDGPYTHGSPGNYQDVISVGSYDRHGGMWPMSSYGSVAQENNASKPDYIAPGVDMYSPVPKGGYDCKSGTSFAAPVVSGLAALITEQYGSARAVKTELLRRSTLCTIGAAQAARKVRF